MFLLLGDHAGNLVPERLNGLGTDPRELDRHIALDLGIAELGRALSGRLDAPFIAQRYSRLVIDCNRSLGDPGSIAAESDGVAIPANVGLKLRDRAARAAAVFHPYHDTIATLLAERDGAGRPTIVVSLHSFTPVLGGAARPWQIGVLHGGGDTRFALATLAALRRHGLVIGDNEPYRLDDTDFTVPRHAIAAGRAYVELEIRQDALSSPAAITQMTTLVGSALAEAEGAAAIGRGPLSGTHL